ncbi:hypothetical protein [Sulfurihydrogenibium azorense]|uniref:hypothetical protein n=1 Tax=Sulfurihydrogenibium azorense TaxID=309806 RepID=UPI002409C3FC|nr:hypothetical protein [Sulfurihydrogenibium azorense]MDM7274379.1 hypothetical protein [Sulfurihydrogenibium azorense]
MENDKFDEIVSIYLSIVGKDPLSLSASESQVLEVLINEHGYEKVKLFLERFKELYPLKKPKRPQALLVSISKEVKQSEEKQPVKAHENSITPEHSEDDLDIITRKFGLKVDKEILNILDKNLRKFYISEEIYKKIWQNLSEEEKKLYTKKAISDIKNLKIVDGKKLKEAIYYRRKYLIKKDYNILF